MRVRRRHFLNTAAAGTLALGLPSFLRSSLAQELTSPKRILLIFMPNSVIRDRWVSTGGRNVDSGTGTATDFTLNTLAAPFQPIIDQMTLIHGLNMDDVQGDQHSSAQIRVTTGQDVDQPNEGGGGGNLPLGPSVDTLAAELSPVINGTQTPFKQLVFNADTRAPSLHHQCVTSDMSNAFIAPENSPSAVFSRLFADQTTPTPDGPDQSVLLEQARARKQSVLDFWMGDIDRLTARVPASQKQKLDSHMEAVRALEVSLNRQTAGPSNVTLPTGLDELEANNSVQHPQVVQGFFDIARAAFQLDLTRAASFSLATGNSRVSFADFAAGPSGGVHNIAHGSKNTQTEDDLSTVTLWYGARVTEFVQSLAAIPEADGSMLDNTLIFFFSEVGQYHEHDNVPLALIGGKNVGHTGGRVLTYDNRQVNDLGATILSALGVTYAFGDPRWNGGLLPELFA